MAQWKIWPNFLWNAGCCKIAIYWWETTSCWNQEAWRYFNGVNDFEPSSLCTFFVNLLFCLPYVLDLETCSVTIFQEEERNRNSMMFDLIYVHESHPLARQINYLPHQIFAWGGYPPEIDINARLVMHFAVFSPWVSSAVMFKSWFLFPFAAVREWMASFGYVWGMGIEE